MNFKGVLDELISSKILSLLFYFLEKIEKDPELYVYPYAK
jgi:hypothetical protein